MFTGALASSYYGKPRTTTDIDIVVKVAQEEAPTGFTPALKRAGLQVNEERIDAAFKSGFRIASFRDSRSPFTVDIIFSSKELKKKAGTILGLPTFYQTPEELILSKLRMIKATVPKERALKDKEDVKAILRFTKVNTNAIEKEAEKDSTTSILETIIGDTSS